MIRKYTTASNNKIIIADKPKVLVGDIACKDGSSLIYYDTGLSVYMRRCVAVLTQIYRYKDVKINISSGYRTLSHNRNIGAGTTSSLHTYYGSAVDHQYVYRSSKGKYLPIPSWRVAAAYQICDAPGIAIINRTYVHMDTRRGRTGNWRASEVTAYAKYVVSGSFFGEHQQRPQINYRGIWYKVYGYRLSRNRFLIKFNNKNKWISIRRGDVDARS